MELRKTSESVNRSFDNGEQKETVESVKYNLVDDEGKIVGNATVWHHSANVQFSLSGFNGVADGEAALKAALGIPSEESAE